MKIQKIGIIAPSSIVPKIELTLGVKKIIQEGFQVDIHPQCWKKYLFFAGTDSERAGAFFEYASNPDYFALWCARGGYGSMRLLPLLEKMTQIQGKPQKKLLIGHSDATALMEYVRQNWGWAILHAPMPSFRPFSILPNSDWKKMTYWVRGWMHGQEYIWTTQMIQKKLIFWTPPPSKPIQARLLGGNLTVWTHLLATRFQPNIKNCFLFFEDVGENPYRIDRMIQQLLISGSLNQIKGIVLGNFLNCHEIIPVVLKKIPQIKNQKRILKNPKTNELKPLRNTINTMNILREIFSSIGEELKIPVAFGLPVGHGPRVSPLPLDCLYQLSPQGDFQFMNWH